jgi:hypothetical protein
MRARAVVAVGALLLPSVLLAQAGRITRPGRTTVEPAPLPPEMPVVARALNIQRSRWTVEGYSMLSSVQVPAAAGGAISSYTTFGAGTRADYRIGERWSATMDMTASPLGGPAITETAEVGTRFAPTAWSQDFRGIRPYFDVRAAYMHMYDTFASPLAIVAGQQNQASGQSGRYSRGFGAVAGTGIDIPLTNTFALSTEISGMRNRMTTYRLSGVAGLPSGSDYWMTSFRLAVGIKYNAVSALHMAQNPTQ